MYLGWLSAGPTYVQFGGQKPRKLCLGCIFSKSPAERLHC